SSVARTRRTHAVAPAFPDGRTVSRSDLRPARPADFSTHIRDTPPNRFSSPPHAQRMEGRRVAAISRTYKYKRKDTYERQIDSVDLGITFDIRCRRTRSRLTKR